MIKTALSHPNKALVIYWGNENDMLRIPTRSSLSMTLQGINHPLDYIVSLRTMQSSERDKVIIDGVEDKGEIYRHFVNHLDGMRRYTGFNEKLEVTTKTSFPVGSGLAGSAASASALAEAFAGMIGKTADTRLKSIMARRGSGSASRSVFGGFVMWQKGNGDDSSYARQLYNENHWDLHNIIAMVSSNPKKIKSIEGMKLSKRSCPEQFYSGFVRLADPHLEQIEKKVLFNVESMRRSPSAVAYRNLIEGIKMMPQPQQTVSHDGKVNLLTFSPRGSLMATAVDNVLWLRNVTNLPLRKSIDGPVKIQHAGTVSRIEFSPDGKYLATVVRNEGVRIWQVEGMRELPPIPQKNTVAIAFSHDGKRIVIGGRGANLDASDFQKTASVWDLDGNVREVATVETKSPVIDVSFDSNGKLFTTLNQSDESEPFLNFWNAAGGLQRKPANAPVKASGDAMRGGFSPSGKHVAVVSQVDRKGAQVWNTDNGKVVLTNRQREFIQFSPDGRFLVTSSADDESDNRRTYIWDVTGDSLREVRHINYRSIIREGAFSPDGKYLALVSLEQESVQVWDPVVGRVVAYMKIKERNPQIAFNEDGSFLAISAGNDVTLWPITDDWQNSFVKHTGKASAISADGKLMAVTNGSVVQLLNTRDQAMFSSIETPCRVEAVVFDWQSERVATAGGSCGVWVWQIAGSKTGTPVRRNGETRWIGVDGLAFSKDGRFLAVAAGRGHVIEIANPSNYTRFPAEGSDDDQQIESVAFSADGERLVTASRNGLDIWERNAPKQKPQTSRLPFVESGQQRTGGVVRRGWLPRRW